MSGKIVVGVAAAFVALSCGPPSLSNSQPTSTEARIVYELFLDNSRLFSILPDGSARVPLTTPKNNVYDSNPMLSPDGSTVVFTRSKDGGTDLFGVGIDGEGLRRLTTGKRNDDEPVWSPDGTRILWVKGGTRHSRLMVMASDGSGKTILVANGDISGPSWSPDGSLIAFARSLPRGIYDDDTEIFVADADGADIRRVTTNRRYDWSPLWLPDNEGIVYFGRLGGSEGIIVTSTDGTTKRLVTAFAEGRGAFSGVLSPDGSQLAYTLSREDLGDFDVYITVLETGETRPLVDMDASAGPAWSPDGGRIALSATNTGAGSFDLFTVAPGGTDVQVVSDQPGDEAGVDW